MENNQGYDRMLKNLADVVQEAQLKIGYDRHPITLYYPAESVARQLGCAEDADAVGQALAGFGAYSAAKMGAIDVARDDKRFCFRISADAVGYIHENIPESGFLRDFLGVMCGLEVTLPAIEAVFRKYSDKVVCEPIPDNEEFNYLLYFADGQPDDYRYCIALEDDGCAVYHRFTPADYAAFGF